LALGLEEISDVGGLESNAMTVARSRHKTGIPKPGATLSGIEATRSEILRFFIVADFS
jgi:hypothetical protein